MISITPYALGGPTGTSGFKNTVLLNQYTNVLSKQPFPNPNGYNNSSMLSNQYHTVFYDEKFNQFVSVFRRSSGANYNEIYGRLYILKENEEGEMEEVYGYVDPDDGYVISYAFTPNRKYIVFTKYVNDREIGGRVYFEVHEYKEGSTTFVRKYVLEGNLNDAAQLYPLFSADTSSNILFNPDGSKMVYSPHGYDTRIVGFNQDTGEINFEDSYVFSMNYNGSYTPRGIAWVNGMFVSRHNLSEYDEVNNQYLGYTALAVWALNTETNQYEMVDSLEETARYTDRNYINILNADYSRNNLYVTKVGKNYRILSIMRFGTFEVSLSGAGTLGLPQYVLPLEDVGFWDAGEQNPQASRFFFSSINDEGDELVIAPEVSYDIRGESAFADVEIIVCFKRINNQWTKISSKTSREIHNLLNPTALPPEYGMIYEFRVPKFNLQAFNRLGYGSVIFID